MQKSTVFFTTAAIAVGGLIGCTGHRLEPAPPAYRTVGEPGAMDTQAAHPPTRAGVGVGTRVEAMPPARPAGMRRDVGQSVDDVDADAAISAGRTVEDSERRRTGDERLPPPRAPSAETQPMEPRHISPPEPRPPGTFEPGTIGEPGLLPPDEPETQNEPMLQPTPQTPD